MNGKPSELVESVESVLQRLPEQISFKNYLRYLCQTYNMPLEPVEKCLGGLYRVSCKGQHSDKGNVLIYAKYWEENELLALIAIFNYFDIKFIYWNTEGEEVYSL